MIKYGTGIYKAKDSEEEETWLFLILELAQADTLFDYIIGCDQFPESLALHYFESFILGLQAIHNQGICHRDIKCENIFIDKNNVLKIADFGFAAAIDNRKT